ncbi:MauE/DoxX family redox-associated membrane protein [Jatrophihabitans sp.]|uniref:MauE/DoxX family redox-associated membrane protein n=1 Tax=Jatrophihabitans sp. TaxID=1932789 RepID=UPI002D134116|nr:MauE/DoxX family redox-associated membrane protein [Jatrophihabitans sp.]
MAVRCLLALVLAAAAVGKVWHPAGIEQFGLVLRLGLGVPHASAVAGGWVVAEGLTALLLVPTATVRPAAALATAEFALLTAGAAVLVARRRGFSCPCFGNGNAPIGWPTVLRNAALTAAALLLVLGLRLPQAAAPAPVTLAAVLTVGLGAVLGWQAPALRSLLEQAGHRETASRSLLTPGGRR